jgi:hypothetical protein
MKRDNRKEINLKKKLKAEEDKRLNDTVNQLIEYAVYEARKEESKQIKEACMKFINDNFK